MINRKTIISRSFFTKNKNYKIIKRLPYGITIFSNGKDVGEIKTDVLQPYGITLFSNFMSSVITSAKVLQPYGITLFSNAGIQKNS